MSAYETVTKYSAWCGSHAAPVRPPCTSEHGFALFTILIIVIIVGILGVSGLRSTELAEVLAGNSIQRSRAFQSAEGGLMEGERIISSKLVNRVFSSTQASDGIFSSGSLPEYWWRDPSFSGAHTFKENFYPGAIVPPVYVVEEVGSYLSDGGSGIVSLDIGAAAYGRRTISGREIILLRFQATGVGSVLSSRSVVEALYVQDL